MSCKWKVAHLLSEDEAVCHPNLPAMDRGTFPGDLVKIWVWIHGPGELRATSRTGHRPGSPRCPKQSRSPWWTSYSGSRPEHSTGRARSGTATGGRRHGPGDWPTDSVQVGADSMDRGTFYHLWTPPRARQSLPVDDGPVPSPLICPGDIPPGSQTALGAAEGVVQFWVV